MGPTAVSLCAAFRTVADAVHREAPGNAMVWSPNYGGGYPFTGGPYVAKAGSIDFKALDTNGDGTLTMDDDMYAPFYPGDTYVDWVGLTLYWFGYQWPWGENERPDSNRFAQDLVGAYEGAQDERAVPNFYAEYALGHHKPMVLSETAALYNPDRAGTAETAVKSAWMDQVLNPDNVSACPQLKMINWFEYEKKEQGINGLIDWRATAAPSVLAALKNHLAAVPGQYLFAPPS